MSEPPSDAETPMQRALRLKKAAAEARPKPPGGGASQKDQARVAAGKSKPWRKR